MSARGGGARVRLRPLRASDATVYAAWMADDELRELTGTEEPLTEDDVIGAARMAEADEGVAAFVVLTADGDGAEGSAEWTMVGDVNIRMNDPDDPRRAEVDVMVAERSARRKGVAAAAVRAALAHGTQRMGAGSFVAKIKDGNEPSRRLFERLGFRLLKHVAVFSEAHWVLDGGPELDHARRAELDEVSVV